jgi:hypothetical protein
MNHVRIRGGGVAALTCAHLLNRAGMSLSFEAAQRPRLPAILLSEPAQYLIAGVFDRPDLFAGLPPIHTRIVSWGAPTVALPHRAVVVSEESLLARLGMNPETQPSASRETATDWTIRTLTPESSHSFGLRPAGVWQAELRSEAEPCACWIESLETGWLFLITYAPGKARLLAAGDLSPDPLATSTLVSQKVAHLGECAGPFPTAPRIAVELCGGNWLACGSAAMGFDPLCGDGTAHAVREAVLACAVLAASASGEDPDALRGHYRARLIAGFERHLNLCRAFYCAPGGAWWDEQSSAIDEGMAWCRRQLASTPPFRYRLNNFVLERV